MTAVWTSIVCVAIAVAVIKAAGPVLVGGRELGPRVQAVIALFAPALLTALVIVETFGGDRALVLDARAAGVGAAALALALRVPLLPAMGIAALVTAAVRAFA